MPFPRRGRRRPFINTRWQLRRLEVLCLFLAPAVRSTLTAWMKIYGETNNLPGLVAGPIEVRFRRLREHTGADVFLLWTTPEHWAAGEALSLWIPGMGLALECRFEDGKLIVDKARPLPEDERDPRRQRSAIGMELRPERIELPLPDQEETENPSAALVAAFERQLDRRWTSFVDPLREALEAEARDDAARAERLATPYAVATPRIGSHSESDPYRLSGVETAACAAFDEGEWLDLLDARGRVISSARLVRSDPAEGTLDVDVRGADPPSEGTVRPRPQTQILAQKRAILDELDNPTGGLANAVKLVASPASLPPPQRRRPAAFVNRLVAQNRSQVRAVSLALGLEEGQALMIQGPPGTGKSTTLAEILGQLVTRDKNVTVLVCSHSNHGVDNLLMKTIPYLESVPELAIARVGLYDRVNPAAREHYVPPGEDLGAYNVVFTTVDALALQVEAGARTYDYAVLDEANRASILDSLIPLVRGRRFVLVGDHLQLQPVLSEAEEQLRLEPAVGNNSAIGKSLFAWLRDRRFPEAATVFLDEQNRMHPVIAGLISEVFYEGKLRSGRRAPRRVADVSLFPAAVTWVDTRGLHGLREARGRGASLVNVPEARLVATIARHILGSSQREVDVGVISAYAEQTALLRRLLLHRGPRQNNADANGKGGRNNGLDRAALKHLEIDTVDAFEGREKDIIIVSLVRSNRRRDIGFLRLMQRINVALSRARTMLIIVGDTSTLRGSYFDKIVRYVRGNGMLVPGPRLIGRLLNARSGERTAERTGDRPAGRRRRPLPSVRTAFPEQAPPAATAGTSGEELSERRGRRRRRRVRGRPGAEERTALPAASLTGALPLDEPGPDEPATQHEIDRFAALVEQLLGDGPSDEATGSGADSAGGEIDRAHAEEVLADALRAVGEQAERSASSRSRRGNNRRRSRRGQGRPLPGDAAIAEAARRMAREEADQESGVRSQESGGPGEETADRRPETGVAAPWLGGAPLAAPELPGMPEAAPIAAPRTRRTRRPTPLPTEATQPAPAAEAATPAQDAPGGPLRRTRRRVEPVAPPAEAVTASEPLSAPVPAPDAPVRRVRRRAVADLAPTPEAPSPSSRPVPTPLPSEPVTVAPAPAVRPARRRAAAKDPVQAAPVPGEGVATVESAPAPAGPEPAARTTRRRAVAKAPAEGSPPPVPLTLEAPPAPETSAPAPRAPRRRAAVKAPAEVSSSPVEVSSSPVQETPPLPLSRPPESVPTPAAPEPTARAPRRRTAATMAAAVAAEVAPSPPPAPAEATPAPAPAARTPRKRTAAKAPAEAAPPVVTSPSLGSQAIEPPAAPTARAPRKRAAAKVTTLENGAATSESAPETPTSRPRRTRTAAAAAPAENGTVMAPVSEGAPTPKPRRTRRTAEAASDA